MFEEIPAADASKRLLDSLFGQNWEHIGQAFEAGAMAETASLLLAMLATFSIVALTIGTLLMSYTILIGVIGTAHDGKPLGEKMSTLWTPIRGAMGVALLIPTAKGLSMLMVAVLTCMGFSVQLANHLSGSGYEFLRDHGGQVTVAAPPSMRSNAEEIARQSLQVLAYQQYMRYKLQSDFSGPLFRFAAPTPDKPQYTLFFSQPDDKGLRLEQMGAITIPCNGEDGGDPVCRARAEGIKGMLEALRPAAHTIAASVLNEQEREDNGVADPGEIDPDALLNAVDVYLAKVYPVIPQILQANDPEFQEGLNRFVDQAQQDGWLMLGSYYWTVSRFAEHTHNISTNIPEFVPADMGSMFNAAMKDPAFLAMWQSSEIKSRRMLADRVGAAGEGVDESILAKAGKFFRDFLGFDEVSGPVSWVAHKLTEKDPIVALSSWGHMLIGGIEALWAGAVGAELLVESAAAAGESPVWDVASFGASSAAGAAAKALMSRAMQLVTAGAVILIVVAFFAAFYLPLLPFVLWIGAVIGWLILVVETLFAAPLWAVAHMIPEGDGMAGQHGRQGYMLLFGILARPPLMVAGLFCSMVIMAGVGKFVGEAFLVYYSSVSAGHVTGIATWIAQSVILIAMFVVFAHKIFGLTTHLPEKVIRWIGGGGEGLGEHSDESRIRGIVMAASNHSGVEASVGKIAKAGSSGGGETGGPRRAAGEGPKNAGQGNKISQTDRDLAH